MITVWQFTGSSVAGHSHLSTKTPCQDKFQAKTSVNGKWLAITVCDGAGSAEFSERGAAITSEYFCQELVKLAEALDVRPPGEWINDFVIDRVIQVRERLREVAQSDTLRKFHCTLVAALVGESGGFTVHIGDGAIFGGCFSPSQSGEFLELNSHHFISKPENGEYANETFFVTEGNWVKHLRITPLPPVDWLIACTDGGGALLLDGEATVKPSFVAPFVEHLINTEFADPAYVQSVISDPKANKLTTDDKTIVVATRRSAARAPVSLRFTLDPSRPVPVPSQVSGLPSGASEQVATAIFKSSELPHRRPKPSSARVALTRHKLALWGGVAVVLAGVIVWGGLNLLNVLPKRSANKEESAAPVQNADLPPTPASAASAVTPAEIGSRAKNAPDDRISPSSSSPPGKGRRE